MTDRNNHKLPAVQLDQVSFRRHGQETDVLTKVSLGIASGEWVAIAGRNGSGKSTLVRLMNGLLPATEGSIAVHGIPLLADTLWEIRSRIGIVFANPDDQFVGLTVADDIAFGLENACVDPAEMKEIVQDIARQMKLEDLLDRHPATLSGGQKQRAAMAAVLAMKPSIVIFDEAASMLDERSKHELLELMAEMKQSGKYTLIAVTHDWEEMAAADRLLLLDGGTIIADGLPEDVLTQDELLARCRLQTPYPLLLCRELKRQGMDIGEFVDEGKVLNALWEYHSRTYRTDIAKLQERSALR